MTLQFDQVTKNYREKVALKNVSFSLPQGAMAFLTGHSGAGKSTLIKLIMMMDTPTSGQVLLDDQDIRRYRPREIAYHRRKIGLVFQNHQLLQNQTVFENVALPLKISGYTKDAITRRVRAALDMVALGSKEKQIPVTLSAGEQQRVCIARAIVNKPRLIIADEPTGNLDPELSAEIMSLFQKFHRAGVSVLVATHDHSIIQTMKVPIMQLQNGQLIKVING